MNSNSTYIFLLSSIPTCIIIYFLYKKILLKFGKTNISKIVVNSTKSISGEIEFCSLRDFKAKKMTVTILIFKLVRQMSNISDYRSMAYLKKVLLDQNIDFSRGMSKIFRFNFDIPVELQSINYNASTRLDNISNGIETGREICIKFEVSSYLGTYTKNLWVRKQSGDSFSSNGVQRGSDPDKTTNTRK